MRKNEQSNRRKKKQKIMIKRLVYFNLYWKFMCIDKNNDKSKINVPAPSFHSFLNC